MKYQTLPNSSLEISKICLGTMTFGEQNSQAEAFDQIDYSLERGVNFIDTAEMYPVPPVAKTQGKTEQFIGNWLAKSAKREKVIIATKVAGPRNVPHIRPDMSLNRRHIHTAIDDSLNRLKTDYVDLYQLHWPQRETNYFGQLNYPYPDKQEEVTLIETLEALAELVRQGKVRYIGLSNETPWGVMKFLQLAEKHDLPRMVSIQNPYNLLNRSFEVGLSEVAHYEGVQLLAYSPMAFGCLSGKYLNNQWPEGARCTKWQRFARYFTPQGIKATQAYVDLANQFSIEPAQMALAFVNQRPFVASNIIGATSMKQLQANIDSIEIELSNELLQEIEKIGQQYSNPCP
ncbi:NADP(H)-dependent aldo-keto reductase [Vibrio sp. SCSIO 43137]|uniref:NADP(H)-dependent aldo-keto reductase n=1 Tax=Vibrio sp. SCSIO 43137 TaxID=3021011 RepID=UPI0023073C33|nr:NADP(H)-dependent aldo-keto reductase [Vibrio sp. SCSIO 43137]WCE29206.1 NADP(H)-dependent aldo-keto reductase [Vibrio sp. SCSIO 43137]